METSEFIGEKIIKKRGFFLSAFLILKFIANPITAIIYFSNPERIVHVYPKATIGLLYFMGVMCLVNMIFAVGIWVWKKWGVYGTYVMAAIAFCINIYIGIDIKNSLFGLIGSVVILVATNSKWKHFS